MADVLTDGSLNYWAYSGVIIIDIIIDVTIDISFSILVTIVGQGGVQEVDLVVKYGHYGLYSRYEGVAVLIRPSYHDNMDTLTVNIKIK
mmetsp:Transcript_7533/g.15172  ORF Transcript_7533/g.15172 Transcript_7533/m.15172 type:complete len:89 (+) Transcript_7533:1587-1853(+)